MRDNSREYTLSTPGGSVVIGRSDSAILRLKDIEWNAAFEAAISSQSQGHGSYVDPAFKGAGTVALVAKLDPAKGSEAQVEAARSALVQAVNSIMGDEGSGTLQWTNRGASDAIRLGKVWMLEDPSFAVEDGAWTVQLLLASQRPFAEDADATIVDSISLTAGGGGFSIPLTIPFTLTASGGGSLSVTHAGDFPKAYPVLQVYGPAVNPSVINQTANQRIVFEGSIAAGEYWEIDLAARSVKLNGLTTVRAVDPAQSTWFTVARGMSTLQLSCSGFTSTTKLRALMRSTWA